MSIANFTLKASDFVEDQDGYTILGKSCKYTALGFQLLEYSRERANKNDFDNVIDNWYFQTKRDGLQLCGRVDGQPFYSNYIRLFKENEWALTVTLQLIKFGSRYCSKPGPEIPVIGFCASCKEKESAIHCMLCDIYVCYTCERDHYVGCNNTRNGKLISK